MISNTKDQSVLILGVYGLKLFDLIILEVVHHITLVIVRHTKEASGGIIILVSLISILGKVFTNDTNASLSLGSNTDQSGDTIKLSFNKALGSIQRVNPHNTVIEIHILIRSILEQVS